MADFGHKASVRFENVQKSFGDVKVLENFDLDVQPGEFVVLLGASGSGKTTALRILSGLETPSAGQVYIDDENVTDILPKYRNISMVFQSYALYPHKTVAENIGFPLKVRRVSKEKIDEATRDALTGLFNARYFEEALHYALASGEFNGTAISTVHPPSRRPVATRTPSQRNLAPPAL